MIRPLDGQHQMRKTGHPPDAQPRQVERLREPGRSRFRPDRDPNQRPLQLVGEGKLELDAPVARYWPEFAAAGKAQISVRQLLCHQAGLPAIRANLPAEALYDWAQMCAALAAEQPWWTPGDGHGYAPITYGWLWVSVFP